MFDMLTGTITVPQSERRFSTAPRRGDEVVVRIETFDMKRFEVTGTIVDTEIRGHQRKTGAAVWEVSEIAVLLTQPDGESALGRFRRRSATDTEIEYRNGRRVRLTRLPYLPAEDRQKLVRYLQADAERAAKQREHALTVTLASRAIELTRGAEREAMRQLRAAAAHELGDHERALADWDAILGELASHPTALHGRARTRYALGDRGGALADARRALAAGIEGAARLIELLEPKRAPSNRVRHKTYGDGTITRRLEGDKLEIAFGVGTKTLLAKFVEQI